MRRKTTADKDQKPEPEGKKTRKVSSGLIRDKARTKARMVAAVGKVIQQKGYTALTAHNIGIASGVDKKLIWTHFGGIDNLIGEYLNQKDFWKIIAKGHPVDMVKKSDNIGKNEINGLLQSQLEVLLKDKVLQKIIHWELGDGKDKLRAFADKREENGEEILSVIAPDFENADVDIRARLALLVGGIYYLTLHAKGNGSTFCGIDMNEEGGKERITNAIRDLIFEAYEKADIGK